jgi:hypothetical protein
MSRIFYETKWLAFYRVHALEKIVDARRLYVFKIKRKLQNAFIDTTAASLDSSFELSGAWCITASLWHYYSSVKRLYYCSTVRSTLSQIKMK